MKNKDISKIISHSLGEKEDLNEALVAQDKQFSLPTEELGKRTKANHFDLYKAYVEAFNKVSAELDSVNKTDSNSNHSNFRSLKIDEVYNLNAVYPIKVIKPEHELFLLVIRFLIKQNIRFNIKTIIKFIIFKEYKIQNNFRDEFSYLFKKNIHCRVF